jgi:hypothetical protein
MFKGYDPEIENSSPELVFSPDCSLTNKMFPEVSKERLELKLKVQIKLLSSTILLYISLPKLILQLVI